MNKSSLQQLLVELIQNIHKDRKAGKAEEEVFKNFKDQLKRAVQENRMMARDIVITTLQSLTDDGREIDPSSPGDRDINIWRWCWASFLELGDPLSAERVIETCYTHLLKLQQKNDKRYHKGTPLQTRAEGLIGMGQWARAKRFVILAYIEDLITGQKTAPAWQTLKLAGVSDSDLDLIEGETGNLVKSYKGRNRVPFYPEEVFQKVH